MDNNADNIMFSLPPGLTEEALVDCIIHAKFEKRGDEGIKSLLFEQFKLEPNDALLALERVCAGVIQASKDRSVKDLENCPNRENDSLAWFSYQRCKKEPFIIPLFYPELELKNLAEPSVKVQDKKPLLPVLLFVVLGTILVLLL